MDKERIFVFTMCGLLLLLTIGLFIYLIIINNHTNENYEYKKWLQKVTKIKKQISSKPLNLYHGKEGYRLGDMVRFKTMRREEIGESFHYKHFPNSIASEYMRKTNKSDNISILADIINKKTDISKIPDKNTIVIHLRTGDVIENSPHSVLEMLSKQTYSNEHGYSKYVSPLPYLDQKVKSCNSENIIILSGSHYQMETSKSNLYILIIEKYFQNAGYHVELRLGEDPDEDIIFMSNAKYFIPATGGGYTKLVSNLVKQKGGKVL